MIDYTTTDLLEVCRTVCLTPEADALFTDTRLLALLTGEQNSTLVPQLLSVQEEFFVHSEDQALTTTPNQAYAIPERAIARKIHDICLIDSAGNESYIQRIYPSDVKFMQLFQGPPTGWTFAFYFQDDSIILPVPPAGNFVSLRVYYCRRPSNLVAEAEAAQITVIDTGTNTITVNSAAPFTTGDVIDYVKGRPGFVSLEDDATITGISNNDITFASLPSTLSVGDWISPSGTTPIPQVPYEAFPLLAQLGACKALEGMGDPTLETAWGRYKQMKQDFFTMITPRADTPPQKIVSPNNITNRGTRGGWGYR